MKVKRRRSKLNINLYGEKMNLKLYIVLSEENRNVYIVEEIF